MKRIMLSTTLTCALLATGFALAGPAQALTAAAGAPATGDVLGVFSSSSDCRGVPDGTFDDVFLLDPPGTSESSPVPAGAQCLSVTNLTGAPIRVVLSSGSAGATAHPSSAVYRCGNVVDVAPGQTGSVQFAGESAMAQFTEICVTAGIEII